MRVAMGEDEQQGRSNPGLLSDVCEAVIAALCLGGGLPAAKQFLAAAWTARIEADRESPSDPKTELQEWAQAMGLPLPRYSEVDHRGPPHDPIFTIAAEVTGQPRQLGRGRSKRVAEQDAAAQLLAIVKDDQRSEEHTSELQSLMRISYAVFCLKKKNTTQFQSRK